MPELMREASPFLRNIIIFRNPVDRYFSAFYYYRWVTAERSSGKRKQSACENLLPNTYRLGTTGWGNA